MLLQLLPQLDTQALFLDLLALLVLLGGDGEVGLPQRYSRFASISGEDRQVASVTGQLVIELRILLAGVRAIFTFCHKDSIGVLASAVAVHLDRGLDDLMEILPLGVGQQ